MAALESMKDLSVAAAAASAIDMKDLAAAAEATILKPEGLTLQQTDEGGKTRWAFADETP